MGPRNPARLLAPLALVAAFVAVIVVVMASRPASSESDSPPVTRTPVTTPRSGPAQRPVKHRVYVVRSGDSLSVIAERTGVTVDEIQALNPGLDADALRVGQRLKLAP